MEEMSKQQLLEKVVIDLLLKNRELEEKVKEEKESSDLWYNARNKLQTKVEELENTILTFTEPKQKLTNLKN
jgi:hypothetical protein